MSKYIHSFQPSITCSPRHQGKGFDRVSGNLHSRSAVLVVGVGFRPALFKANNVFYNVETSAAHVEVSDVKNYVSLKARQGHNAGFVEKTRGGDQQDVHWAKYVLLVQK